MENKIDENLEQQINLNEEQEQIGNKFMELNEIENTEVIIESKEQQEDDLKYIKSDKTWSDLNINSQLINQLQQNGYKKPSQIQAYTIQFYKKKLQKNQPLTLVAQSQNGSGKTLSFLINAFETVDLQQNYNLQGILYPQVVILSPTQALCAQIYNVALEILGDSGIKMGQLSGISQECQFKDQYKRIDEGHILVATPQGLCNTLQKNAKRKVNLDNLKLIALDEADFIILDENQSANLQKILGNRFFNPDKIKLLVFSATFPKKIFEKIRIDENKGYAEIKLNPEQLTLKGVSQFTIQCQRNQKKDIIYEIFQKCDNQNQTIIFVNNKDFGRTLMEHLRNKQISCALFMGNPMSKEERSMVINLFRKNEINVLITTNVLARGIDMRRVLLVINADLPINYLTKQADVETYLHRIGRTGRFGDFGVALNLIEGEESKFHMQQIQQHYKNENVQSIKDIAELNTHLQDVYKKTQDKRKDFDENLL